MLASYLKRGAYNSFFFAASSAITRGLNFIFLPYLLSKLTLAQFGIWEFYQVIFSFGILILGSTISSGMFRFYIYFKDHTIKQNQSIGNALLAASCVLFLAFVFFMLYVVCTNFKSWESNFLFTIITIALYIPFSLTQTYLRMREQLIEYMLLSCGQSATATFFTLIGIRYGYALNSLWYGAIISYLIFLPFFFRLFFAYRSYSASIMRQQMTYSLPLLAYSLIYTNLLSIDKWFISSSLGIESLGKYGILARFGSIFQFVAVAIMDTWPILLFNAEKEKNSRSLISHLMRFYCLTLTVSNFCICVAACLAVTLFLPLKYHHLSFYLPLFFLQLVLLEYARIFQAGLVLTHKTFLVPLIGIIINLIQSAFLFSLSRFDIEGIMIANSISFMIYGILSQKIAHHFYQTEFSSHQFIKCMIKPIGGMICLLCILTFKLSIPSSMTLCCAYLIFLFFSSLNSREEKIVLLQKVIFFSRRFFKRQNAATGNPPTVLYLRTDICSEELTAGGSVAHTLGVIDGFKAQGLAVLVASSAMPTILQSKQLDYYLHLKVGLFFAVLRWKLNYMRWRLECIFSTFIFFRQIQTIFKSKKIDFIYQRYSLLNGTGVLASKIYDTPLILEYNGSEVWQYDQLAPKKWFKFNPLAQFIEQFNLAYATLIVVVSEALKDELILKGIDKSKILVNPNGVDTDLYNPEKLSGQRISVRRDLKIEDKFVFGFVGTFSFWHGIETIGEMIIDLSKKFHAAHFLLIGDGILKKPLEEKLKQHAVLKNATFTGLVSHDIARNYLAACDAFLCPTLPNKDGTRFFGSPTKLFEYMSLAKPIIASDLEQIGEIMQPAVRVYADSKLPQNAVGVLVKPDSMGDFVKAAECVLQLSVDQLKMLGNTARTKVIEKYTWDKHCLKIYTQLQLMIATKRR